MSTNKKEGKMITVIQTMCRENYAAHNGFTGEYYWKNKPGSTYIVESVDPAEIKQVVGYIEDEPNDVHYEYIVDRFTADADYESEFVKSQKEYDPEGWDTLYLDRVIRKGKSGAWYMKRGYIVGGFNKERPEFAHLVGKFVGNVDNLTTGECVLNIEGDTRKNIKVKI